MEYFNELRINHIDFSEVISMEAEGQFSACSLYWLTRYVV